MASAWRDLQSARASGGRNYYVPMADLLAGLVFILIIVLQAVALVAREDFAKADEVMRETRLIEARLEKLRAIERSLILPRERTEATLAAVVEAIARDLAGAGLDARIADDGRRIAIRGPALATPEGFSPQLPRTADAIGGALERWLPCLRPDRPASCPGAGGASAAEIRIEIRAARGAAAAGATAAALNAELALRRPELAVRQGPDGAPLVSFRGFPASADTIDLAFAIQRAPLPPDTIIIGPR
jgi:hypothetical protein